MAVAVDGTNDRLKAALSVDGGVRSGGRVYAGDASGSAGRYNAAVSHRLEAIGTIRAGVMTAEEGASNRSAKLGMGYLEAITTIRAGVMTSRDGSDCSMDDSDCLLRLSEDGVSAGYALRAGESHGHRVMNGTYHASVGMGDRGTNDLYKMKIAAGDAPIGTIEAAASTFDSGCGCSDGIGTVRALIEIL